MFWKRIESKQVPNTFPENMVSICQEFMDPALVSKWSWFLVVFGCAPREFCRSQKPQILDLPHVTNPWGLPWSNKMENIKWKYHDIWRQTLTELWNWYNSSECWLLLKIQFQYDEDCVMKYSSIMVVQETSIVWHSPIMTSSLATFILLGSPEPSARITFSVDKHKLIWFRV